MVMLRLKVGFSLRAFVVYIMQGVLMMHPKMHKLLGTAAQQQTAGKQKGRECM